MQDRSNLIAEFIVAHWDHDRDALLCAIISRFPDLSGAELQQAIDAAGERRAGEQLAQRPHPAAIHQGTSP
jgi:hypothetical protein